MSPPILNLLPLELPVPTTDEIDISFSHGLLDFSITFGMSVSSLGGSFGFWRLGKVFQHRLLPGLFLCFLQPVLRGLP